jgi:hypothetical protein
MRSELFIFSFASRYSPIGVVMGVTLTVTVMVWKLQRSNLNNKLESIFLCAESSRVVTSALPHFSDNFFSYF